MSVKFHRSDKTHDWKALNEKLWKILIVSMSIQVQTAQINLLKVQWNSKSTSVKKIQTNMGLLPLEFTDCLQDSPYFRDSLHSHEKELERTSNSIKELIKDVKTLLHAAKSKKNDKFFNQNLKNLKFDIRWKNLVKLQYLFTFYSILWYFHDFFKQKIIRNFMLRNSYLACHALFVLFIKRFHAALIKCNFSYTQLLSGIQINVKLDIQFLFQPYPMLKENCHKPWWTSNSNV